MSIIDSMIEHPRSALKLRKTRKAARCNSERGASLVGYSLLVALIAVVSIGSMVQYNKAIRKLWCEQVMQVTVMNNPDHVIELAWTVSAVTNNSYCLLRDFDSEEETQAIF